MKIYLVKRSYFHFRGKESFELDILGKSVLELMRERLGAEIAEGEIPAGDKVVLYPVYPFLTEDKLNHFLKLNAGSFSFEGGYAVRGGNESVLIGRAEQGLFSVGDYAAIRSRAAREVASYWAERGAFIEDGAEVSYLAQLQEGAIVERGARVIGACVIGKNATIGADCEITESEVGEGSVVRRSVLERARVGRNSKIGPFAYLRPYTTVGDDCRVGDFVELKNCDFGNGSKAAHLSYVGDAKVGKNVNIGCGAVFVNYNGRTKSETVVGDNAFIGSNCNLIAPVGVGKGSYLAAGTTLTKSLNGGDFCIGRCRETVKEGRAKLYLKA